MVPGTRDADGMTRFLYGRDIRIFKHRRKVEHRDWHSARELASRKKSIFNPSEQTLLKASQHGEFNTHGCRRADLARLVLATPSALSRQLTRSRMLWLIKKRRIPIAATCPPRCER